MAEKKQKSLKLNFIMNALLSMSSFIFPLITYPYVTRILTPTGTGKVSFAFSVVTYFVNFAQLGIPTYGVRACAMVRDDRKQLSKTFEEIFLISCFMCLVAYVGFIGCLLFVPRIRSDHQLFLVMSSMILFYTIGVEWLYKSLEQYSYITIRSLIFKLIGVVGMFVLVHEKSDYVIYGALTIFAVSASSIMNFVHMHNFVGHTPLRELEFRRHIKPILIFFAMSCATTVYVHLDSAMLGFMTTDADCGYYDVAVKVKHILTSLVTSLGAVLLPRISYYVEQKKHDEFIRIAKKAMNFILIASIPLTIYFVIYARECILFLSGDAYLPALTPMHVIMFTVPLIGLTNLMGIQILVPLNQEKYVLYSEIAGAVVDVILNAILIPQLASTGAAIGTLFAEASVWVVQFWCIRKLAAPMYREIHYGRILIATAVSSFACYWVKLLDVPNILSLMISAVIFFTLYLVILVVLREEFVLELVKEGRGTLNRLIHRGSKGN